MYVPYTLIFICTNIYLLMTFHIDYCKILKSNINLNSLQNNDVYINKIYSNFFHLKMCVEISFFDVVINYHIDIESSHEILKFHTFSLKIIQLYTKLHFFISLIIIV